MNTIRLNVLGEAKAASSGVSIKNQDKSVDITENGVTEVTADSGYTGLGKVTINANVQGGGASSAKIEYFAYSDVPKGMWLSLLMMLNSSMKFLDSETGDVYIGSTGLINGFGIEGQPVAFQFCPEEKIYVEGTFMTLLEFVEAQGGKADYDTCPRITEEQFYTI